MPVTADHWDGLCTAMDRPDLLIDRRFEGMEAHVQNEQALHEEIEKWCSTRTKYEAMETIAAAGAAPGPRLVPPVAAAGENPANLLVLNGVRADTRWAM